jgi:RNA polymerase sigma factor (sigma-70 family)
MAAEPDLLRRHIRQVAAAHLAAELPDPLLLERFAARGEEAAFAALVRRHGPLVWGVCWRLLRQQQDAEDAFQVTFLLLARKAGSLKRPEALGPWLHGVATRTALKARTGAARRRACERQAAAPAAPAAGPADDGVWRDLRPVLDQAVGGLPEKYRVPFILCYLEGRTVTEVAERLGCPRGTVATRLAWARQQLRTRLARRGLALSAAALPLAVSSHRVSGCVPRGLAVSTARAATAAAGDGMVPGAGLGMAAALARGGKAMLPTKVKVAAAVLLAIGVVAGGVALYGRGTPVGVEAESGGGAPESPACAAGVLATVNGEAVLAEDVYAAAYLALPNARELAPAERARRIAAAWKDTLDRVVEREAVWQDAATALRTRNPRALRKLQDVASAEFGRRWAEAAKTNAGVKDDEELNAYLRGQGTSLEALRRQWERAFLAGEYLRFRVRGPAPTLTEEAARQQRERLVADLRRRAVIEYVRGR